ncbi:spondin domain-containing protein [Methylomonas sp. EFPC1]|uniref:spondin domain-containing protein n=1 Tax=Methylomonas sp. EFPC1 TaxID=2812647 RepID=UPI00196785E3|nr:spondin domain-containing protein [Methylomonas sp. EFPC1]QSB03335.1 spondin domain-containing protein [Methylomonas sp. EFPC1]
MQKNHAFTLSALLLAASAAPLSSAEAAQVTLSFSNLSAANGPALSPFFIALHDGTFDAFDLGTTASSAIEAIAEMGSGAGLSSAFAAGGTSATVTAAVNAFGPGIFLPGAKGSVTLDLDPVKNRYLSYFAMVVPSNDRFVGNDSPTEIELFDAQGHFTGGTFVENGSSIWDAGTELDGTTGAAFLVGSNALDSPAQNGTIQANHDFAVYAGLGTPAGYNFTDLPGANTPLLQISAVSQVPVPAAAWLFGSVLPLFGWLRKRAAVSVLPA